MQSHHLVSNTNHAIEWGRLFAYAKLKCHENSFEELVNCCETSLVCRLFDAEYNEAWCFFFTMRCPGKFLFINFEAGHIDESWIWCIFIYSTVPMWYSSPFTATSCLFQRVFHGNLNSMQISVYYISNLDYYISMHFVHTSTTYRVKTTLEFG